MKISPFPDTPTAPATAAGDDEYSFYYSFLQDPTGTFSLDMIPATNKWKKKGMEDAGLKPKKSSRDGAKKKMTRRKKKVGVTKLVTSLAMSEEREKSEKQESDREAQSEIALLESDSKEKTEPMLGFQNEIHGYYPDAEESNTLRSKRGRFPAAVAVSGEDKGEESAAAQQHQRRLWVKDRSKAWWDKCNHPDFPESEFVSAFRMRRATFDVICEELGSAIAKEDTMLRAAIPVRQRVAVCIWRLATGEPLREVSKRFGLGISTCHKLVLEVCSAIKNVLMPKYLQWSSESAAANIESKFESISGIPNIVGSIYTTHIPIIAPKISVAAYFNKRHTERNQKTSYSITVQGVVDSEGVFTDVCIGWPGSMPDDQVLEKSALYQRGSNGLLTNQWIVGSSGYPLMDWMLVPYHHHNLTWTQHAFNEKIGEVQRIAREAFARLKGRWKCLQKRTEVKLQDLPVVIGACCVLHNVCETMEEEMEPELRFKLVDDEIVSENPLRSRVSMQARDNIAHNLLHHGLAGTTFFS